MGLTALAALLLVSCSGSSTEDGSDGVDAPPPEPAQATFVVKPAKLLPGELFSATFDPANSRGGYFTMSRWNGNEWAEPAFLLESDVNRPVPSAQRYDRDLGMNDYGAEGPGPDGLVLPHDINPGTWRLCTANARDDVCAQVVVGSGLD